MEANPNLNIISGTVPPGLAVNLPLETVKPTAATTIKQHQRESLFRLVVLWLMGLGSITSVYAVGWDIQWHVEIGRDNFWTPPHLLLYSVVGLTGAIALFVILFETIRYHRGSPTVTAKTTTSFLGIFHAPLGVYLVGFGILGAVIAAPFDDYWHQLYGIDLTIWSAFHVMGIISSLFAGIGVAFGFASEYNRSERRSAALTETSKSELNLKIFSLIGMELAMAYLLAQALLLLVEALFNFTFTFGDWRPTIYSSLVGLTVVIPLLMIVLATGRIGTATLTAAIFTFMRWTISLFVPSATDWLVQNEGLTKRSGFFRIPTAVVETYPANLIVVGLLIDLSFLAAIWLWSRKQPQGSFKRFALNFGFASPRPTEQVASFVSLARVVLSTRLVIAIAVLGTALVAFLERPFELLYRQIIAGSSFGSSARAALARYGPEPALLNTFPLIGVAGIIAGLLALYLGLAMRYTER